MADQKKEEKEIHQEELNINATAENIKLIGNKREREITEEDKITLKICACCKSSNSYFKESEDSQTIYDIFSKDAEFMNILKQNIDNAKLNENLELNCFCRKCLLNEFIKGGIERIFTQKKLQENDKKDKKEKQEIESTPKALNKKIRELISIYSLNLMIAINNLKKLKEDYSLSIKNTIEIFDGTCIQILLSKHKESFPNLKTKIDNCKLSFDKIDKNFDNIIINLTKKDEMQTFIVDNDNNANQKSKLLKLLKNLENEIENDYMETPENNIDKNTKEQKMSKEQTKKNISELLIQNNDLMKNSLLLSQNYLNNGPNLFNNGLGILPFGIPSTNPSNNSLLNNLMLNPQLNPSVLNQINNTINLNSMLSNMSNNVNETTKNINNLNNIPYGGINNLPGQNLSAINTSTLQNLEYIMLLRNILNNNNNTQPSSNLMNNLYSNQMNSNLIPSISLNSFLSPNSQTIPQNLNNNNINPNTLNNNNNLNREKNLANINPNLNSFANINNMNLKDINSLNNLNNVNEPINNNFNKIIQMNPNIQNPNDNQNLLTKLFNSVADEKKNEKNGVYSNNNSQK